MRWRMKSDAARTIPTLFHYEPPTCVKETTREVDVLVYGGTSAGVTAAVHLCRQGRSVVVANPSREVGGLSASGLGFTDVGNKHAIGGLAATFYQAVGDHYGVDWKAQFEPHVASKVFKQLLSNAGVEVLPMEFLLGVESEDGRLVSATFESGLTVRARQFIDATYEGDLAAMAGVTMHVGRESNAEFGETRNGVQCGPHHQFSMPVDPYVLPGVPSSGLLPGIEPGPLPATGSADHRVQAYNFRMCMTDSASNRRPFPVPATYDPLRYELLARVLESGWPEFFKKFDRIPNGKTDTNNHGPVSSDFIGGSHFWPRASHAQREALFQAHVDWQAGLYHFLNTSPRIPKELREAFAAWGLAADEFPETGGWPHQLYIREGRRMRGAFVMTENHCTNSHPVDDPAGLGAYQMDSHNCRRFARDGRVFNEGDVQARLEGPYGISYRALVPRKGECSNLLVPCALSATHIAFGSLRMEPVFMVLGQSCAIAADLLLESQTPACDLPYADLRPALLEAGQILHTEHRVKSFQFGE